MPTPHRTRDDRPNVLVIMSDEHNADVTGCYGNALVRTPNLDRLAETGVTFDCAYTNSPLCVPARLSFTAGKYVSRIGAWSNNCWLESDETPSLPRAMNAAGYQSFLCGKMHYDATRRYGFTDVGGNFNRGRKHGRGARRRADDRSVDLRSRDGRFADFHAGDSSFILDHDRNVTAGSVDFLRRRGPSDGPFFLLTGYLSPHFPLIAPEEHWRRYEGKVPMPAIPPGLLDAQPRNYHHLRRGFGVVETDPDLVRRGRELYYGLTDWMDVEIGKVLDALADGGHADNTVIIYTSDHGENIGEHGMWWKNCMYDHAARIPLIVSWPGRWAGGQRRTEVCSLVDLVKGIAEIGGADVPADWDGDSLCRLLDGDGDRWHDMAVSEYSGHNIASGFAMLRQGRWKYVYHTPADDDHPAERELYDMAQDPREFNNLATEPDQAQRIAQLHATLVAELGEEPDESERRCREQYARGYARDDVNA